METKSIKLYRASALPKQSDDNKRGYKGKGQPNYYREVSHHQIGKNRIKTIDPNSKKQPSRPAYGDQRNT